MDSAIEKAAIERVEQTIWPEEASLMVHMTHLARLHTKPVVYVDQGEVRNEWTNDSAKRCYDHLGELLAHIKRQKLNLYPWSP